MFGVILLYLLILLVGVVVYLWMAKWIYEDAEERGESGVLWLLLYLLFFLVAVIIWLIVRPSR